MTPQQKSAAAIPDVIRSLRAFRGWTQEDLAAAAGMQRSYIAKIEQLATNPKIRIVERISLAFGVPMSVMFLIAAYWKPTPKKRHRN